MTVITAILALVFVGIFVGPSDMSMADSFRGLVRSDDNFGTTVIWSIRLPRLVLGFLVGASLGLSGVLIQLSARSPLGDPNLFGIGGGASIFIAVSIIGLVSLPSYGIFIGSIFSSILIAAFLTLLISNRDLSPIKFSIMGIAVGSLMLALGTSVVAYGQVYPAQVIALISGSFTTSDWTTIYFVSGALLVSLVLCSASAEKLSVITLGDDLSRSLGVDPVKLRIRLMAIAAILAGSSVYAAGLIAFVALTTPHIARRLVGNSPSKMIFMSMLMGGMITIFSDQIGRLVFAPVELPVGLTTTIIGAPLMIYLIWRYK